jgi:tetratricopeptide (TPR) repeat protein
LWAAVVLAQVHAARGNLSAAEEMLLDVLDVQRRDRGEDHRETALTLIALADLEIRLGRPVEAEARVRSALSTLLESLSTGPSVAEARSVLGGALAAQGRLDEAAPLLEGAYADLSGNRGARRHHISAAAERLRRFTGR